MKKFLKVFLGIICMFIGFCSIDTTVKADIYINDLHIDGSKNIMYDGQKLKEVQYDGVTVWRAGADVTYCVDSGQSNVLFVAYGESAINNTASKSGYEFVGWRKDTAASGDVLSNEIMLGESETLYAVFRRAVTVNYYNGSTTKQSKTDYIYYNNGNYTYPKFTISQNSLNGWTTRGWSTSSSGDAAVKYSTINNTEIRSDITLYGIYQKAVTVNYYNGSTTKQSKTDYTYYNSSGNTIYPQFTISQNSLSGWTSRGWSTGTAGNASVTYSSINNTEIRSDITLYGIYQKNVTLSYDGNGASGGSNISQSGTAYYNSSGNTVNPSFSLNSCGFSKNDNIFSGWTQGSTSGTLYKSGASVTLSSNTVFYAKWQLSVVAFDYTGGIQLYTVPCDGIYQFEVWGAEGGCSYRGNGGGFGGYSKGNVYLNAGTNLYIAVGGAGTTAYNVYDSDGDITEVRNTAGGYNGGGSGADGCGTGGGATHIGSFNSTLAGHGNTSGLYIVAGGGGGGKDFVISGYNTVEKDGGDGGGETGGRGYKRDQLIGGGGGTQSSGGECWIDGGDDEDWIFEYATFGQGGNGYGGIYSGPGGGGGLYGGGYNGTEAGAGGGSGYIGGVSDGYMESGIRGGNGYAKITIISTN